MSDMTAWDAAADNYDADRRGDYYRDGVRACVRLLGSDRSGIALDCGSGTGLTTMPLIGRFQGVIACDFSRRSLELLKSKPGTGRVLAVQADMRRLPFPGGAFSRVLCANALQHFTPADQAIVARELCRVAGNRLVVSAHHFSRAKRRAGWIKEGKKNHEIAYVFRFIRTEFARLFPGSTIRSAGFSGRIGRRLGPLFRGLAARLGLGHLLVAVDSRKRPGHRANREDDGGGAVGPSLLGTRNLEMAPCRSGDGSRPGSIVE